ILNVEVNMIDCYIEELGQYVGQEVRLKGWVYNTRSSGKVRFIVFRDGTGMIQAVLVKSEVSEEVFNRFDQLTQETSVMISGPVKEEERAPGGYEMLVKDLQVVQVSTDYPISPKEHTTGFLMEHRHLWLRSTRQWHIMRVRNEIIQAIRQY